MDYVVGPDGKFKLVPKNDAPLAGSKAAVAAAAAAGGGGGGGDSSAASFTQPAGKKRLSVEFASVLASAEKTANPSRSGGSGSGGAGGGDDGLIAGRGATGLANPKQAELLKQFARRHADYRIGDPTQGLALVAFRIQKSRLFATIVILCILASAYFLATEYPSTSEKGEAYLRTEMGLNAVFTIEFGVKITALRWGYFASGWNVLDLLVLLNGWMLIAIEILVPDRFAKSLAVLKLARVLRPIRALSIVPALREIINALLAAIRDLSATLLIVAFFLVVFATFLGSLLSGVLRYRCYDHAIEAFHESRYLVCSPISLVGRQCPNENATCEDSGVGEFANLTGLVPFYLNASRTSITDARPFHANPPYTPAFDAFGWSVVAVFQVWAGVGWTALMYHVADSQGRGYEALFMLMHILGAWFLVNLMVAVLGASFEREQMRQKVAHEERRRAIASLRDSQKAAPHWLEEHAGYYGRAYVLPLLRRLKIIKQQPTEAAKAEAKSCWADLRGVQQRKQLGNALKSGGVGALGMVVKAAAAVDASAMAKAEAERKSVSGKLRRLVTAIWFRAIVVAIIAASTFAAAAESPFMRAKYGRGAEEAGLKAVNTLFGVLFWIEAALKLGAWGLRGYFASVLNCFDAFTNFVFLIEVLLQASGQSAGFVNALKVFRMLRVFKLAASLPQFRALLAKMGASVRSVASMLVVLSIFTFFASVLTLHLFHDMYDPIYGGKCSAAPFNEGEAYNVTQLTSGVCGRKPRHHFDNIAISYITVFQIMTTDNWVTVMWDAYDAAGPTSLVLFPLIIIVGNFVTLNIFLAILLSTFTAASRAEAVAADAHAEAESIEIAEAARMAAEVTANANLLMTKKRSTRRRPTRTGGSPASPNSRSASPESRSLSPPPTSTSLRVSRKDVKGSFKQAAGGGGLKVSSWHQWEGSSPSLQPATASTAPVRTSPTLSPGEYSGSEPSPQGKRTSTVGFRDATTPTAATTSGTRQAGAAVSGGIGGKDPRLAEGETAASAAAALGPDATLRATRAFRKYDADASGYIDFLELRPALLELGLDASREQMLDTMSRYDIDSNNQLDLGEFLMLVRDTPPAPPTALGRFVYGMLPIWLQVTPFVRKWVAAASRRSAQAVRARAQQRSKWERKQRVQRRSLIRARQSKYGTLNAWEVAYFRRAFELADIDGDGFLLLDEVYALLIQLDEEASSPATWDVLDANAAQDDLISKDEFLVFVSIKRKDDEDAAAKAGVGQGGGSAEDADEMREKLQMRRQAAARHARKRTRTAAVLRRRLSSLRTYGRRVYLDRLPPLGEFAREGLGEERARFLQRLIYSNYFWYVQITCIVTSALLVTSEIDAYIRRLRLAAGMESLSWDGATPSYLVAFFDSAFLMLTSFEIMVKLFTEGLVHACSQPWNILDLICFIFSFARLLFSTWRRFLFSFSSLRIFMLLPRFKELRLLSESILRALPNVGVTMCSLLVIWLMFAVVGVALFGGKTHQCALLNQTWGLPGCGINIGSTSYNNPIGCRYARAPLPVPPGIVPGETMSAECGCMWDLRTGVNYCRALEREEYGDIVAWVPGFPSFDSTPRALLALLQISTLDGWASIMHLTFDAIALDTQPAREASYFWPIMYFLAFIIFGVLFATNVFVGVVIDEFNKIRRIYDGSATLTEEQVKWVNTQRLMLRLSPEQHVTYEPPPEQLQRRACFRLVHDAERDGWPTNAPSNAKYYGKAFERVVRVAICLNVAVLTLWSDPMDPSLLTAYDFMNSVFVVFFLLEACIKIVAHTFKEYIRSPWNAFDFFLVVASILSSLAVAVAVNGFGYDVNGLGGTSLRWARVLRVLRIVRLVTVSPSLTKMMRTMLFASPSVANITVGIFLFTSAYAQFGMAFLGTLIYDHEGDGFSRHANFETAFRAFSALIRMSTADNWSAMLADAAHNPHVPGVAPPMTFTIYFFFVFYMAFMGWVLISIFVAIILEYFNESNWEEGVSVKYDDLLSFQRKWLEFDVQSTSYIRTVDVGLLLYSIAPPLVGVQAVKRDGFFFEGSRLARPTISQLETILVELDLPEHDGSIHFLELLLALLQRMTGVIHEEQIMARLLHLHPAYVPSVKRMPAITGSTADAYVRDEIMAHLRRGLEATGLYVSDDARRDSFCQRSFTKGSSDGDGGSASFLSTSSFGGSGSGGEPSFKPSWSPNVGAIVRSFTRGRSGADSEEAKAAEEARKAEALRAKLCRRSSLSQVAASNAGARESIAQAHRDHEMRRASRVWAPGDDPLAA